MGAPTLHAEPGRQEWLDLLRPTCWAIERRSDNIFLSRGKKPWGQRSTKDHGAVGEWIAPRIWIEVGTGTLAVKGEVESGAKNDDNASGAREDVTSPLKNMTFGLIPLSDDLALLECRGVQPFVLMAIMLMLAN